MVVRRYSDRLGREVGKEEPTSPTKESRVESATVGATDTEEEEEQGLVIGLVVVRDPRSWAFEERPMGIGGVPSQR